PLAVGGSQIFKRRDNAAKAASGHRDIARLVDARCDDDRVMARAELGKRCIASDFKIQVKGNAAVGQQARAPFNDFLLKLEPGNAIDHQPAGAVIAVIDMHLIAALAKLIGGGEAARARADDADGLRPLNRRDGRLDPAIFPGGVGDVFLNGADGDGAEALLDHAGAFAEPVLRADAAADFGEIIGRLADLIGFFKPAGRRHHQPVRNVVVNRAVDLAERNAALPAAAGLRLLPPAIEFVLYFVKILPPFFPRPLVRHFFFERYEFQHFFRHQASRSEYAAAHST